MPKHKIRLGDEIEDVTTRVEGIAIGRAEYLSGQAYWIIQPYSTDDNVALREIYVPEGYCKYKGEGVYIKPKPQTGFSVGDERNARKG